MTTDFTPRFDAYLPMDRRQSLARGVPLSPASEGCCLIADVTGFTALTGALAEEVGARRGAEEIAKTLQVTYDRLIERVHRYGGSVIGFAGDAISCWFDADDGSRAVTCGLSLAGAVEGRAELEVKVGIARGLVRRSFVGDPALHRLEVIGGATVDRAVQAEKLAKRSSVVVDDRIAAALGGRLRVESLDADGFSRAVALNVEVREAPWPPLPELALEAVRPWLLPPVFERLRDGQGDFLAELRLCAPVFLRLEGPDYDADADVESRLDQAVRFVQRVLAEHGGWIIDINTSVGATDIYAGFGAPVSHPDNPERAVRAARALCDHHGSVAGASRLKAGIGLGRVRAGPTGSAARRAYAALGKEVNLAARLMARAEWGQVLVSESVATAAARELELEATAELTLKGVEGPVRAFSVRGIKARGAGVSRAVARASVLVGRTAELSRARGALRSHAAGGAGGLWLVKGAAGIGKSRLVAELVADASESTLWQAYADPIKSAAPYQALRPLFAELLELDAVRDAEPERVRAHVVRVLAQRAPAMLDVAPLIDVVLPVDFPDNEVTRELQGAVRGENTLRLLAMVLEASSRSQRVLLVVEDAHWLDTSSLQLLGEVIRHAPSVFVLATARENAPSELEELAQTTLELASLDGAATADLARNALGVEHLPPGVTTLVAERSKGHPLYAEQLIASLLDTGVIRVAGGVCTLVVPTEALDKLDLPTGIEGLITSRVDRLAPALQVLLKAASVLGTTFDAEVLDGFRPRADGGDISAGLEALEQQGFVSRGTGRLASFKHALVRDVAYGLMDGKQRSGLHRGAARFYEEHRAPVEHSASVAELAHHYSCAARDDLGDADVRKKAVAYSERAAHRARGANAYREAVQLFTQAEELAEPDAPREARAARSLELAQTYRRWGRFADGRAHLEKSLVQGGAPVPERGMLPRLLGQVARQAMHRVRPRSYLSQVSGEERDRLVRLGRGYNMLSEVAYFADEKLLSLYSAVRTLNLQERAGPSPALAQAYAAMGLLAGLFGLRRLSDDYLQAGLSAARSCGASSDVADVLRVRALCRLGVGRWDDARTDLLAARESHELTHDNRHLGDTMAMLGMIEYFRGDFRSCEPFFRELFALSEESGNRLHRIWAMTWSAGCAVHMNRLEDAEATLESVVPLAEAEGDKQSLVGAWGLLAQTRLRLGRIDASHAATERVAEMIDRTKGMPTGAAELPGYVGLAESRLAGARSRATSENLRAAEQAAKYLSNFGRFFPMSKPFAPLVSGGVLALSGKHERAAKVWRQGAAEAERLGMHYAEAQLLHELGSAEGLPEAERGAARARSEELFARLDLSHRFAR